MHNLPDNSVFPVAAARGEVPLSSRRPRPALGVSAPGAAPLLPCQPPGRHPLPNARHGLHLRAQSSRRGRWAASTGHPPCPHGPVAGLTRPRGEAQTEAGPSRDERALPSPISQLRAATSPTASYTHFIPQSGTQGLTWRTLCSTMYVCVHMHVCCYAHAQVHAACILHVL